MLQSDADELVEWMRKVGAVHVTLDDTSKRITSLTLGPEPAGPTKENQHEDPDPGPSPKRRVTGGLVPREPDRD